MKRSRIETLLLINERLEWSSKNLDKNKTGEVRQILCWVREELYDLIVSEQKMVEVLHDIMRVE